MSGPLGSQQWMYATETQPFYPYTIDNSLRFDGSSYLYRVPTTTGDRTTWTASTWIKRSKLGVGQVIFGSLNYSATVNEQTSIFFAANDTIRCLEYDTGAYPFDASSTAVFRDTSAWYHIVWVFDSTNATDSLRSRVYVNGVEIAMSGSYPPSNHNSFFNHANTQFNVGALADETTPYVGLPTSACYLAETHFVDGTALSPSDFGEFKSGIWVPKAYSGSYGTNGFHLDFADGTNPTTLGSDAVGSNDFTPSGIATSDQMLDSPTNNFATLNPLTSTLPAYTEGNTRIASQVNVWQSSASTMLLPRSGKWYVEGRCISGTPKYVMMGIQEADRANPYGTGVFAGDSTTNKAVLFNPLGNYIQSWTGGADVATWSTFSSTDVGGIVWDATNGDLHIYKNGAFIATAFTGVDTTKDYVFLCSSFNQAVIGYNFGNDGTFGGLETGGNTDANGYGDFAYTPPTGALALCTQNLPDPAFDPRVGESPQDAFNVYTDTGANILSTAQGDYSDGLFWIKDRANAADHQLLNTVTNTVLESNTTDAERAYSAPSGSSVAWSWKAATAFSGTTNLGKSYSGKSNAVAGISIVTYTGAGSGHQIPHNLADVPKFIVIKQRTPSGTGHVTYHASQAAAPELGYLLLGTSGAYVPSSTIWADTAPTSSYVTLGASSSVSSNTTYTMLAFAEKEGFSKFGSYEGNGDTTGNGPFVYLGFRPAFVLIKNADQSGGHWVMYDNARDTDGNLNSKKVAANLSDEENNVGNLGGDTLGIDFLSNGFKIKIPGLNHNNTVTYIYAAFAEQPFKYSNAR